MIISDGRRLAYYSVKANSGFWSRHWRKSIEAVEWKKAERGFLGWFEEPFNKHLSKAGFKVIDHLRYDAYKGIKEELPSLRNLLAVASKSLNSFQGSSRDSAQRGRGDLFLELDCHGDKRLAMTKPTFEIRSNKVHLAKRPWWLKLADRYFGHMTMIICIKR